MMDFSGVRKECLDIISIYKEKSVSWMNNGIGMFELEIEKMLTEISNKYCVKFFENEQENQLCDVVFAGRNKIILMSLFSTLKLIPNFGNDVFSLLAPRVVEALGGLAIDKYESFIKYHYASLIHENSENNLNSHLSSSKSSIEQLSKQQYVKLLEEVMFKGEEIFSTPKVLEDKTPSIAVLGKANVGKSSLVNSLFKENKVKVGDVGDTTIEINYQDFPSGLRIYDTPGRGGLDEDAAKNLLEFLEKQKRSSPGCKEFVDIFLYLIDSSSGLQKEDYNFYNEIKALGRPVIMVLTKSDSVYGNAIDENKDLIRKYLGVERRAIVSVCTKESSRASISNLAGKLYDAFGSSHKITFSNALNSQAQKEIKIKNSKQVSLGVALTFAAFFSISNTPKKNETNNIYETIQILHERVLSLFSIPHVQINAIGVGLSGFSMAFFEHLSDKKFSFKESDLRSLFLDILSESSGTSLQGSDIFRSLLSRSIYSKNYSSHTDIKNSVDNLLSQQRKFDIFIGLYSLGYALAEICGEISHGETLDGNFQDRFNSKVGESKVFFEKYPDRINSVSQKDIKDMYKSLIDLLT